MALETGTYISDLVATNPTSSDPKSQGDDHLRLLKSTIKATFPNINGAMNASDEELNNLVGAAFSLSGTGSVTIGGWIVKWGSTTTSASADVTVTFSAAFPNAFLAGFVCPVNAGGSSNTVASLGAVSASSLAVGAYQGNTGSRIASAVYWLALGK